MYLTYAVLDPTSIFTLDCYFINSWSIIAGYCEPCTVVWYACNVAVFNKWNSTFCVCEYQASLLVYTWSLRKRYSWHDYQWYRYHYARTRIVCGQNNSNVCNSNLTSTVRFACNSQFFLARMCHYNKRYWSRSKCQSLLR